MRLAFTKLHGCGNDYVYVDCTERPLADAPAIARVVSDRRTGIGSDGLILVCPSEAADFRMEMYNADGSRGKMCGNGIRAFAKYVRDHGLTDRDRLAVDTDAGVKTLDLERVDGKVARVRVEMGRAELEGPRIPVRAGGRVIEQPLEVDGRTWNVTCVSMGNPHCVTFDEDPGPLDVAAIGPGFERHPFFPESVNTEFVRVASRGHLVMRVWERGSGETFACGTGACAVAVAAKLTGRADARVRVELLGGDLDIEVSEDLDVVMTGPAAEVFSGTIEIPVALVTG
jgi:diaminopimelate epimerase